MVDGHETGSERATSLSALLEAPIPVRELDSCAGEGKLDYEVYLRTSELLSLQHPSDERVHPDELVFQIVHQAQELWLKLLAHECVVLVDAMDAGDWGAAERTLERCRRILRSLHEAMEVLSTLTPKAFQVIRRSLGEGSGLQSPGFAGIRAAVAVVDDARRAALERSSTTLESVYRHGRPSHLLSLCESLADLDVAFQQWLTSHFHLVRRTIGVHREVPALDGYPTKALEVRMKRPLFPELWEVRIALTKTWNREGGFDPSEPRCPE